MGFGFEGPMISPPSPTPWVPILMIMPVRVQCRSVGIVLLAAYAQVSPTPLFPKIFY